MEKGVSDARKWPTDKTGYNLLSDIGCGATAIVKRAECQAAGKLFGKHVAIKVINLEQITEVGQITSEVNMMSSVWHENLVEYYTSFVASSCLWIVMPLMDGGCLKDVIKFKHRKLLSGGVQFTSSKHSTQILSDDEISSFICPVVKAIQYLHNHRIIHRDIKSLNVYVAHDGLVKLGDFGVATRHNPEKAHNTITGTPAFMAPEFFSQTLDQGYTQKVDIWAIGVMLYEMLSGTTPLARHNPLQAATVLARLDQDTRTNFFEQFVENHNLDISNSLHKIIQECTAIRFKHRPTATELLDTKFMRKAKGKDFVKRIMSEMPSVEKTVEKKLQHFKITNPNIANTDTPKIPHKSTPIFDFDDTSLSTQASDDLEKAAAAVTKTKIPLQITTRSLANDELLFIKFEYNRKKDTVETVCKELMHEGHLAREDMTIVVEFFEAFLESLDTQKIPLPSYKNEQKLTHAERKTTHKGYLSIALQSFK